MTDAFRCDVCEEYYDGEPAVTLYRKSFGTKNDAQFKPVVDLCESHAEEFGL